MINISFDMETADPDDVLTLCMLSHHPKVNLVSVTVTPGSTHQIGLVKFVLSRLGKDIPIGSKNKKHPKQCVSSFHYKWLGNIPPAEPDGSGAEVLSAMIGKYPDLTIVCGASLGNIGALLDMDTRVSRLVVQGGFAGDNVMPPDLILEKFKGKITCPTFNLNGDVPSALKVLQSDKIAERIFVSKNVCHGVVYDYVMHDFMLPRRHNNLGLDMMVDGMTHYLKNKPTGKAFHDPLAASVAIDKNVCTFARVQLYRDKGEWGSRFVEPPYENPNAEISIAVDMNRFMRTVAGE